MQKEEINPKKKIHHKLKKHSPKGIRKAKKIFGFKYPKLFFLSISILLAYYLFNKPIVSNWVGSLNSLSYLGIFISGILISFGFSAPFAVGFFIIAQPDNLLLATLVGGLGATIGDLLIFKTIKFSFMNEFKRLKRIGLIKKIKRIIHRNENLLMRHYLLYVFAGIIIATPLPDEVGVSMLAGLTSIKPERLAVIAFILHNIAIFLILRFSVSL